MYRWHILDPIRFSTDLKVTMQALGWQSWWRYLPLQDDIASVAFWYQILPTVPFPTLPFPTLPDRDFLQIIWFKKQNGVPGAPLLPWKEAKRLRDAAPLEKKCAL